MLKRSEREEWVDILRGLAVFMVVLGHLYKGYPFHLIVNPIKMPAFYFIAGYVASVNKPIYQIVINRACTLFIPMIIFSLFPVRILYYLFVLEDIDILSTYVIGFINGTINWFIYSFFLSSILFACLRRIAKESHLAFGMESLICFVIGILTSDVSFMKIWSFNTALVSILFMYFGYELRIHQWKWMDDKKVAFCCLIMFILLIWLSKTVYFGRTINYHQCSYYNIPVCIVLIFAGFVFLRFWIKELCSHGTGLLKRFFVSFGQNTIVVYLASAAANSVILILFKGFLGTESPHFLICFVGAVISCLFGYILSVVCRKYIPIFLGIFSTIKNRQ